MSSSKEWLSLVWYPDRCLDSSTNRLWGGLVSESFSMWLKPPKKVPNHYTVVSSTYPDHLLFRWIVLRTVIWHLFFGDLSQIEKLSEIKPPLACLWFPDLQHSQLHFAPHYQWSEDPLRNLAVCRQSGTCSDLIWRPWSRASDPEGLEY